MLNQNQDILTRCLDWVKDGHAVVLYTIINTWGSSPRPPGSIMALRNDGRIAGSVSGGCIEDDLVERLRDNGLPSQARTVSYGVTADQARRFGLPCGGTMRLVEEPLSGESAISSLSELLDLLASGHIVSRRVSLKNYQVTQQVAQDHEVLSCTDTHATNVFGPRYRLLIIGAGQLSALLAQIAISLDYAVTVCDPREEYTAEWRVENTELVTTMPDDTVVAMQMNPCTAVVALTHDPKLDDLALMEALASPAFYVGALGSKANNAKRRERLLEFDLTAQQISRLHGPIGLDIGSHTPAEIAVSIAAELVAVRNNKRSST
ncbi:XdhC family protein [Leucothrix sargassi]|nr:XdhC family protein [Leucothrix sargassi]